MAKRKQKLIDTDLIVAYDTLLSGASAVCSIVALQNRLTKFCDIAVWRADTWARFALSAAAEQIKNSGKELFPQSCESASNETMNNRFSSNLMILFVILNKLLL
jgi:hypothetical protein